MMTGKCQIWNYAGQYWTRLYTGCVKGVNVEAKRQREGGLGVFSGGETVCEFGTNKKQEVRHAVQTN